MIELLVLGALALAAVMVIGALAAAMTMVGWMIALPFRILGWLFKGVALLITLPFLILAGFFGVAVFGFGMIFFLVPLLPFALLAFLIFWLIKRRAPAGAVRA